jgi:hypothetical protein
MRRARNVPKQVLIGIVAAAIGGCCAAGIALADSSTGAAPSQGGSVATIQQVPASLAATYPALTRAANASESQQLPAVAKVIATLVSQDEGAGHSGANGQLARKIAQDGEDAEYLVPGNGELCMVSVTLEHATGGGCAPASSVETQGTTSLTVVPSGYEVSGILPTATSSVSITNASGQSETIQANEDHAFVYLSAVPLQKLVYALPGGGQHVGDLELPAPANAPSPPAG